MKRLTFYDFVQEFLAIRPDNFSMEALAELWNYFEEYEESMGEFVELDVIALCCDYSELEPSELAEFGDEAQEIAERICNERSWAVALKNGNVLVLDF
jgi:hypothetical protein